MIPVIVKRLVVKMTVASNRYLKRSVRYAVHAPLPLNDKIYISRGLSSMIAKVCLNKQYASFSEYTSGCTQEVLETNPYPS